MSNNGALKLNLGAGPVEQWLEGYRNLDGKNGDNLFPLPNPDDSIGEIRASHCLEHFPAATVLDVLKEWVRVLKPEGWLKIAVPDFRYIAEAYLGKRSTPHSLQSYLMGGQVDERDYHKSLFDETSLTDMLKQAGLVDIQRWTSEIKDCASLEVSLNLMGRKPTIPVLEPVASYARNGHGKQFVAGEWRTEKLQEDFAKVVVAMIISRPRYGTLHAADALSAIAFMLKAPMLTAGGAWWEQGVCRSVLEALKFRDPQGDPADVIVTADYDTLATPEDALQLIQLLYQNPQYDCIVPTQIRRGTYEEILAQTAGPVDMNQALVPITSGHFGLTVFRRHVFEKMKAPWFLNVPDAEGQWSDGRQDADMYFWAKFCDTGFKAALATQVICGHLDEFVSWPKLENGKVVKVNQSIFAWLETRKPPEGVAR